MDLKINKKKNVRIYAISIRSCNSKTSHNSRKYKNPTNNKFTLKKLKKILSKKNVPGSWRNNDKSACSKIPPQKIIEIINKSNSLSKWCGWIIKKEKQSSALCLPIYERLKALKTVTSPRPVCQGGKYDIVCAIGKRLKKSILSELIVNSSNMRSGLPSPQNISDLLNYSINSRSPNNLQKLKKSIKLILEFNEKNINVFSRQTPFVLNSWDKRVSTGDRHANGLGGDLPTIYKFLNRSLPKNLQDINRMLPCFVFTFKTGETCLLLI